MGAWGAFLVVNGERLSEGVVELRNMKSTSSEPLVTKLWLFSGLKSHLSTNQLFSGMFWGVGEGFFFCWSFQFYLLPWVSVQSGGKEAACRYDGVGFYLYFPVKCTVSSTSFSVAADLNDFASLKEINEQSA